MSQQTNWVPTSVDLEKPSAARIYDYLLGGNHNFAVDRALAEKLLVLQPGLRRLAIMNRSFLRRATLYMVDAGIRQFLDLGSGIPTVGNVHEIAQQAAPDVRVVYVDNEHVAVAHSQLLLDGNDNATMVHADITRPAGALEHGDTRNMFDFSKPIGLLAVTIGHYIRPEQDPASVFAAYRDAIAPGSHLALTHLTYDFSLLETNAVDEMTSQSQNDIVPRGKAEILSFLGDFELVEPGLVTTSTWRPETEDAENDPAEDAMYAGVARKR